MLYELSHMKKGDPAVNTMPGELRSAPAAQMRDEEVSLFSKLREHLSEDENRNLSREMNVAGLMLA